MAKNFITILSLLVTIIVSVTAYAYKSDLDVLKSDIDDVEIKIDIESANRKEADKKLNTDIEDSMTNHQILHTEQEKSSILLIKYLDQRFDDMEKLIKR